MKYRFRTCFVGVLRGRFGGTSRTGTSWAFGASSDARFWRWLGLLGVWLRRGLWRCGFELIVRWVLERRSGVERPLALQTTRVCSPGRSRRCFSTNIITTLTFHSFANFLAGTFAHDGTHAHAVIHALGLFRASSLSKLSTGQFCPRKCGSLILPCKRLRKKTKCNYKYKSGFREITILPTYLW